MWRGLTVRLVGGIAAAILLLHVLGSIVQHAVVERVLTDRLEALVRADLDGFAALYDQRRLIAVRQAIEYREALTRGEGRLLLSLRDREGAQLAGNLPEWPVAAGLPPEGETGPLFHFEQAGRDHIGAVRMLRGRFPLLVAREISVIPETLSQLRATTTLVALCALVVGLAVGWLANAVVMGRIRRINTLADRVAGGELSARLPAPSSHDEFALLERHIHAMLDRIEALNRATHHLGDTIAHELRTPLGRIRNRLDALDPNDEAVAAALAELRDTTRVFDSLLQIARTETGAELELAPMALSGLLEDMADLYAPLIEERGLVFSHDIAPGVEILGDRDLVAQLLSNLFDNALKFCPEGAEIHLSLAKGSSHHLMELRDTGPGLPEGFSDQLFDRFTRAEETVEGFGLGLALVRAIVLRHGARVVLPQRSDGQGGFVIQIHWPKIVAER